MAFKSNERKKEYYREYNRRRRLERMSPERRFRREHPEEAQALSQARKRVYARDYYERNREKICAQTRALRKRTPERQQRYERKKRCGKYGLTVEQFGQMLIAQAGLCAICERQLTGTKEPHIDHCHATQRVRGLVCAKCNLAIGFYEQPGLREKISAYLAVATP